MNHTFTLIALAIATVLTTRDVNAQQTGNYRLDKLRNVAIGTSAFCEREFKYELPKDKSLDCPNYGGRSFSIEDFEEAGWNVVSIATTPTVDGLGIPFTMYRVNFKKVR